MGRPRVLRPQLRRDSLGRSSSAFTAMEERFALILNDRKIGTVRLDMARRGRVRTRLAPLPAFRLIARHHLALLVPRDRALNEEEPTPGELAAAEGAQAVLESLRLRLVTDPGGAPVSTRELKILPGNPPGLEVWW